MNKEKSKKSIMGKKSRAQGKAFELKVRHNLEERGWVVCKWGNNVDLKANKLIIAKHTFNPFTKAMSAGSGFPDFIAFKKTKSPFFRLIAVESKMTGVLDKTEKLKVEWLLNNNIFGIILIASKGDKRGEIIYEQYGGRNLMGGKR